VEWPGRVWSKNVNVLVRIPVSEERHTKSEGTSSGDTLGSSDAAFLKLSVIGSVGKGKRLGYE